MLTTWLSGGRPTLALDFTSGSLDSRVSFTRSSSATRFNSSGVLESVGTNVARFDYDPSTLAARGLLIEQQRTSKCTVLNRNPTATTGITKSGDAASTLTVVNDAAALAAAGLGTVCSNGQVYKLDNSAGATNAFVSIAGGTGNTNTHIGDAYVRGSGTGWIGQNGSATGRTALTYASSYERKATSAFTPVDSSRTLEIAAAAGAVVYFILFNMQEGSFATSTILHDSAAQATRSADVATMTGSNFSSWYNASAGSILIETIRSAALTAAGQLMFSANNGLTTNQIVLRYRNLASNFYLDVTSGGVAQFSPVDIGTESGVGTVQRCAVGYATNDVSLVANGTVQGSDTSVTLPVGIDRIALGSVSNSAFLNGHIRRLTYYPRRLTNAELQALTA